MLTVAELTRNMILYSQGNIHDINHFLKVHAYARTIGACEQLPPETLRTLEIAALVHDIACPLCREKYGNTDGNLQEREGMILAREFLDGAGLPPEVADRVVYLVGHHHTLTGIDGPDYQILIEADYLVNAEEHPFPPENIRNTLTRIFKTETGKALLRSVYGI